MADAAAFLDDAADEGSGEGFCGSGGGEVEGERWDGEVGARARARARVWVGVFAVVVFD